jgi:hypothetical protein
MWLLPDVGDLYIILTRFSRRFWIWLSKFEILSVASAMTVFIFLPHYRECEPYQMLVHIFQLPIYYKRPTFTFVQCEPQVGPPQCKPQVNPSQCKLWVGPSQCKPRVGPSQCKPRVSPSQCKPRVGPSQHKPQVGPSQCKSQVSPSQCKPQISMNLESA